MTGLDHTTNYEFGQSDNGRRRDENPAYKAICNNPPIKLIGKQAHSLLFNKKSRNLPLILQSADTFTNALMFFLNSLFHVKCLRSNILTWPAVMDQ